MLWQVPIPFVFPFHGFQCLPTSAPQATTNRKVQGDLYLRQVHYQLLECWSIPLTNASVRPRLATRRVRLPKLRSCARSRPPSSRQFPTTRGDKRLLPRRRLPPNVPLSRGRKHRTTSSDLEDEDDDDDKTDSGAKTGKLGDVSILISYL